jgi:hypothetical protein
MNDWQRSFLGKLETAKKHWLERFEELVDQHVRPAYGEFAEFTASNGFHNNAPECERGTRLFKFGLVENGYLLLSFHLRGMDTIEALAEFFVPGGENRESLRSKIHFDDMNGDWARRQFERGLDCFLGAFTEAGACCVPA